MRNKGVFFVKKEKKGMPAENFDFAEHMAVGDIYPNVLDYLCLWVEEVLVPIFNNPENMKKHLELSRKRWTNFESVAKLSLCVIKRYKKSKFS